MWVTKVRPCARRGFFFQQALGDLEDEAGHVPVVDEAGRDTGLDFQAVEEDLVVRGLGKDVRCEEANLRERDAKLPRRLEVITQDGHGLLHGAAGDAATAKDVAGERQRPVEMLHIFPLEPFRPSQADDHRDGGRADVDDGVLRGGGGRDFRGGEGHERLKLQQSAIRVQQSAVGLERVECR